MNETLYRDECGELLTESQVGELFDDHLDSLFGTITIGEVTLDASRILAECDPIAYRVYRSSFESESFEEVESGE